MTLLHLCRSKISSLSLCLALLLSQSAFAQSCDLDQIPSASVPAQQLLKSATQSMAQKQECKAARTLLQVYNLFPLDFVAENGFFTLIKLEIKLGQFDKAMELYKTWPWDVGEAQNFSPWKYVPAEQEPAARIMVWKLFARYIPQDADLCVEDPLTAKCDEGKGLATYDQTFSENFPGNPYIPEMRKITTLFYHYKMQHEMGMLKQAIARYEHSNGLLGTFSSPFSKASGLASILMNALNIEKIARAKDKNVVTSIIAQYAPKLQALEKAHPEIRRALIPTLNPAGLRVLIEHHGD